MKTNRPSRDWNLSSAFLGIGDLDQRRWLPLAALLLGPAAVDGGPDPAAALVRADETARLVRALGRLSGRQRQVLHLVFYEGLTIAEAAAIAGVSVGTARTHYERGKTALRTLLGEERE